MLHYHALYLHCSQADTQVPCGKLHNSKDHDDSSEESRARAIAPHFSQFLTRQNNSKLQQARDSAPRTQTCRAISWRRNATSSRATDCGRAHASSRSEEPSAMRGVLNHQGVAHATARSSATIVRRATARGLHQTKPENSQPRSRAKHPCRKAAAPAESRSGAPPPHRLRERARAKCQRHQSVAYSDGYGERQGPCTAWVDMYLSSLKEIYRWRDHEIYRGASYDCTGPGAS